MTNQEAFERVYRHLMAQGEPALDNSGDCMYRAPDGKKCAVGCLIPDAEYRREFEGENSYSIHGKIPSFMGLDKGLLKDLQSVHDSNTPDAWIERLYAVASMWHDVYGIQVTDELKALKLTVRG